MGIGWRDRVHFGYGFWSKSLSGLCGLDCQGYFTEFKGKLFILPDAGGIGRIICLDFISGGVA